jgi:crotonobetainyl-CoA:carnitine CoA-transferase CaiB-like acyl-CoA transferase
MLSNLKIVDLSSVLAGPSVGMFFAELGAEVLKVEHPSLPDVTRSWKLPVENPELAISGYFSSVNYGKKYLKLDLKVQSDNQTFLEIIKGADILVSNFKHGSEEKLGITDKILREINPKIIIGKINGFGASSDRVAYDLILQAETGFMSMNGTAESGPVKMPVALIDVLAAHQLKEGLLLALLDRATSGVGKTISVSLYDAAVSSLVNQASNYLMCNHIPQRIGSLHPNIAPYGELFTTKSGDTITFAIGNDTHFSVLCHFLALDTLTNDARFNSNQQRVINRSALEVLLQEKIKELETDSVLTNLIHKNIPVGKVKNLKEVFEAESAKEMIREETIEGQQTKRITSIAFKWT